MPAATFSSPGGELPSPEQIMGMDKEIIVTRQRLQQEKQRRIQLTRQMDRLNKASQTLMGVQDALKEGLGGESSNGDGEGSTVSLQKLKESVTNAVDGHEELKVWNARAEEVLQILDKIKNEREEENNVSGNNDAGGNEKKVLGREEDERERKRMQASHGTNEQVGSLLKKLRGK